MLLKNIFCILIFISKSILTLAIYPIENKQSTYIFNDLEINNNQYTIKSKDLSNNNKLISLAIGNYKLSNYYIRSSLGSKKQTLNLALNTKNNLNWIITTNCLDCKNNFPFNYKKSETFKYNSNKIITTYNFTHSSYSGYEASDLFSITHSSFLDKYKYNLDFNSIDSTWRLQNNLIDGCLSISFPNKYAIYLKNNKIIDNAILSINLSKDSSTLSYLTFGGYDKDIVKDSTKIIWKDITLKKDLNTEDKNVFFDRSIDWYIDVEKLYINNKDYNTNNKKIKIALDTLNKGIFIPKSDFFTVKDMIFNDNLSCQEQLLGYFRCKCDSDYHKQFNTIVINFDKLNSITINPEDYITYIESVNSFNCYVMLYINYDNNLKDYWILGNLFISNYYTIMDYDNNKIGFYNIRTEINQTNIKNLLLIVLLIILGSCIFLGLVYLIYKKYLNRRDNVNSIRDNILNNNGNEEGRINN